MFEDLNLTSLETVAIAAGLGGLLGTERELAGKPAGLRTHILVCVGSTLIMILGQEVIVQFQKTQSPQAINADPIRVIHAIVIGISFLGAGTIVHDKQGGVEGLTTAATIYLTAGIGVAVAVHQTSLAISVTVGAIVVLSLVGWLEILVQKMRQRTQTDADSEQDGMRS